MNSAIEQPEHARSQPVEGSDARSSSVRLKVCHVVATAEGAHWMFEQLRELRNQYGCEVGAVVASGGGALVDRLDAEGIPHFSINFGFGTMHSMLRMPREIFRLARFFREQRFDVVQTHIFTSMVFGRIAAWLADVPVRLSMISGPFHLEAHTSRWIERWTNWMETALIPSCEASLSLCRELGVPSKRLSLVYYSADEKRFDPRKTPPADIRGRFGWSPETPVIGMVALFYPRLYKSKWVPESLHGRGGKGHEDLVRAAPTILREFPEAKILFVGKGWGEPGEAYMEEVRELVRSLGLEEQVIFAGYYSDVPGVLCELDVAVQASLNENLGGTLEALLMERPLVATRVGGMVDTVRDGETGVLVNPSDPDDLARGIIQMLRDPERARSLGRSGRQLILERFTLRRTVADLAELYERSAFKDKKRRRGYNPLVSLCRLAAGIPLLMFLAFRLFVVDMFIPLYLPIYLARARAVPLRLYYRAYGLTLRLYYFLRLCFYHAPRAAFSRVLSASYRLYARLRGRPDKGALELKQTTDYKMKELGESDSL